MNTRSGIIHKLRMGRVPGNYLLNLTRKKIKFTRYGYFKLKAKILTCLINGKW